jgi:hypothetical protein
MIVTGLLKSIQTVAAGEVPDRHFGSAPPLLGKYRILVELFA